MLVTIVGARFYPAGKPLLDLPNPSISLEREPGNPYDPNAIKVLFNNTQVGHVARQDAAVLAPILDASTPVTLSLAPAFPILSVEWDEVDA